MPRTAAYTEAMISRKPNVSPPDAVVIDAARHHPPIRETISARAAELVKERQVLCDQIDHLAAGKGPLVERFLACQAKARAVMEEVRAAEKSLRTAQLKAAQANGAEMAASQAIHRAREDATNALKATAENALIDAFRTELFDAMAVTRRVVSSIERVNTNPVTGVTSRRMDSNGSQVTARMLAIGDALSEAEELRLLPDQSRVAGRIAEIKAALPTVGGILYSVNENA